MFIALQHFFQGLFGDIQTTFIWLFAIGVLISGLIVWKGDEQAQQRFKTVLFFCITGLIVFLLANPIIQYVKTHLH